MIVNFFFYGLAMFIMGVVVLLRGRSDSQFALGRQFYWLTASAMFSATYAWSRMFLEIAFSGPIHDAAYALALISMPISGALLLRFGWGLLVEAGPLPSWMHFAPLLILIPVSVVATYYTVTLVNELTPDALARWSRNLLIVPASLLSGLGFYFQWRQPRERRLRYSVLLAAGIAFVIHAAVTFIIGEVLAVAQAAGDTLILDIEVWRTLSMLLVVVLVIASMYIFEVERDEEILRLEKERHEARQMALTIHTRSRQQSEQWLNSLVNLNRRISNLDPADEILAQVVKIARALMHADTAVLALAEENGQDLVPRFQATVHGFQEIEGDPLTADLFQPVIVNGASLRLPEDQPAAVLTWTYDGHVHRADYAAVVPLRLNQQTIGVLWAGRRSVGEGFSCTDLIGLSHLANQAVIALEHSLMAARLQSLAVTEERSRIAREMHDSLAQILGFLGLETQTLEALVRQGETEAVLDELKQARSMIKSAQLDVRENILSLRTTLSGDIGLRDALREYVQEFGIQTGITAQFCDEIRSAMPLSPLAETQCVRIVQEALTNVRKHAQASSVAVTLRDESGWLRVYVKDDGVGLPQTPVPAQHYGLHTMRERAESVGGALTLQSLPAQGTVVQLSLPLL